MEVQLTQAKIAIIDNVDADLAELRWYAQRAPTTFYAMRSIRKSDGKKTTERLHQIIARRMGIVGPPDHKDRDGLNNRRDNLRPADSVQNGANRGLQVNNASGYKGVSWYKRRGKWEARVQIEGKRRQLGYFDDPIEAAKAYDRAALQLHGEFAVLNFPA